VVIVHSLYRSEAADSGHRSVTADSTTAASTKHLQTPQITHSVAILPMFETARDRHVVGPAHDEGIATDRSSIDANVARGLRRLAAQCASLFQPAAFTAVITSAKASSSRTA
jgi:hypothetical protein